MRCISGDALGVVGAPARWSGRVATELQAGQPLPWSPELTKAATWNTWAGTSTLSAATKLQTCCPSNFRGFVPHSPVLVLSRCRLCHHSIWAASVRQADES